MWGKASDSLFHLQRGLWTLTKNAANAMRHHRIRVNAIAPGWMDTPNEDKVQKEFHGADDNWLADAEAKLPMGQLVKPHQLAPLAAYLLSPDSGVITGAIIDYDQQIVGLCLNNHSWLLEINSFTCCC